MKINYLLSTLLMLFFVSTATAQQGINYKAIINDTDGTVLVNTTITVQFTILQDGETEVYKESHEPTTDANGIIIVNIGEGTAISGDFNAIDWGSDLHFLKTEINIGSGLTDMGTTEFKTVPYALYAHTSGNAQTPSSGQYYFADKDGDNYGDKFLAVWVPAGVSPPDYFVDNNGDCDDDNGNINPSATEIPDDGIDQDCNGTDLVNEPDDDYDGDGYTAIEDCDDNDSAIYPGALEVCDGKDNNCNGDIDEVCQDGVHIELTWNTPSDPDQLDNNGADLDIHLKISQEDWMSAWDCYYGNPNPDWGEPGNSEDDPSLVRDDSDGAGPEIINFSSPSSTQYTLGINYVNDRGYGSSFATIKVFAHGTLQFQKDNVQIDQEDFLELANIEVDAGSITVTELFDSDGDGDGYNASEDCDDTNATIYPGAPEIVGDGVDQDCDLCDDCYTDMDQDGYGAGTIVQGFGLDCNSTIGASSTAGDCNDGNPDIFPGNAELCDGKDNDCDGEVDEGCNTEVYTGNALYYTLPQGAGACSYPADYVGQLYAAVSTIVYNNAESCGACINVTGPEGSTTIRVVDFSPDVDNQDLDLSYEAFDLIGDPGQGVIPVSWNFVSCPVSSPIEFYFTASSNEFWLGVVALNHKNPISSVEVFSNNTWQNLLKEDPNVFTGSNLGAGPFHFRITDIHDNVLEETAIPLIPGETVSGTQQF